MNIDNQQLHEYTHNDDGDFYGDAESEDDKNKHDRAILRYMYYVRKFNSANTQLKNWLTLLKDLYIVADNLWVILMIQWWIQRDSLLRSFIPHELPLVEIFIII